MSIYADYTDHEQQLLLQAIDAAAVVVSLASPGPSADTVSEGFAAAEYVLDSLGSSIGNTLISSVIMAIRDRLAAEELFPDYVKLEAAPGAGERARDTLTSVAALLDARATPVEATGYKDWLVQIAEASANAAREDKGFLGRGGVDVNDAERAAIAEVGRLLGPGTLTGSRRTRPVSGRG